MDFDDKSRDSFEDMMRSIAQELGRSVERAMEQIDVGEIADHVGVDPEHAREWVDSATGWLRDQTEHDPQRSQRPEERSEQRPEERSEQREDPLARAAGHPLDLPSDEQGAALAALDSGRWLVEPGSEALAVRGEGPGPSDALGLFRELRVRDWITPDGELTLAGRHALSRWLDVASLRH